MCPRARSVDQLSRVSRCCVRRPLVSTSGPKRLGPGSEGFLGSNSCPAGLGPGSEGPWGLPAVPGVSLLCPRAPGVYQLYRVTRALVRGPPVSTSGPRRLRPRSEDARATSSPGQLGVVSNVPWDRPAVPGDSGPGRTYRGFDQASRATPAHLRVPRGRPAVPGHSCLCPRARGDVQLSRLNVARIRSHSGLTSCPGRLRPMP